MGTDIRNYFEHPGADMIHIEDISSQVATLLLTIGYGVAVIMVLYIGIRFMIATPAQKAQLKTQFVYLLVGSFLLVSGTTILGFIAGVFEKTF